MQRRFGLSGSKRFSQIHRNGKSAANRHLVIRFLANGQDRSRFAFVVSKRIGNAVVRNRMKRRLREAVRSRRVKGGWDAVFIARKGSERARFQELLRATSNLLRRSRLVESPEAVAGSDYESPVRTRPDT
jgi:ribonuclease P protein component